MLKDKSATKESSEDGCWFKLISHDKGSKRFYDEKGDVVAVVVVFCCVDELLMRCSLRAQALWHWCMTYDSGMRSQS